ncbi:hypothetical protein BJ138DRAFT_1103310 [Hygrophoropsis aurantiaca]|uniref:Uncharacterized protein n=1 Tax=Hygrophoropsis aurantiaca TaxID=72124 RepID=A0ACB8A7N2_9AGAM|nr:hypothetical protein BJ138DRAFT_1103310 [Hygrophoropsis aurantiaca]
MHAGARLAHLFKASLRSSEGMLRSSTGSRRDYNSRILQKSGDSSVQSEGLIKYFNCLAGRLQAGEHDFYNDDLHEWSGFTTCIALGFFDDKTAAALFPDELGKKTRFPNGSKVQTPLEAIIIFKRRSIYAICLRRTHHRHPDSASQANSMRLSTPGKKLRGRDRGLSLCVGYAGLEGSCELYQVEFPPRQDFANITRGIAKGLRRRDLLTDVRLDLNARKVSWPSPLNPDGSGEVQLEEPTFRVFSPATDSRGPFFARLSSEELLMICSECTLTSFLSLATMSKSLWSQLAAPTFLDRVMKTMIAQGSLRWMVPVESMQGGIEIVVDAAKKLAML